MKIEVDVLGSPSPKIMNTLNEWVTHIINTFIIFAVLKARS